MNTAFSAIAPLLICLAALLGLVRKVDVFDALISGAKSGLKVMVDIFPSMVVLLTAVAMLRASGALDALTGLLHPVFSFLGIPPETSALMLVRPISAGAATAVGADIIGQFGADSLIGRTAAIMLGSTETTFYVIAVYFTAAGVKNTRYAIPAALTADFAAFIGAAISARLFYA